jgi:hypothetical protein
MAIDSNEWTGWCSVLKARRGITAKMLTTCDENAIRCCDGDPVLREEDGAAEFAYDTRH